jgi:hypothetical protein
MWKDEGRLMRAMETTPATSLNAGAGDRVESRLRLARLARPACLARLTSQSLTPLRSSDPQLDRLAGILG